ncbi:MAG: hypothetical protein JWN98_2059 [Abditibacteriota bacterium]|nr:hypothetical protein [Abditibacteriota bacterium]
MAIGSAFSASTVQATTLENGPSPEVVPENTVAKIEIARLRIHNTQNGVIEGSRDGGQTWTAVGRVSQPTIKVNPRGFTASKYGPPGRVVATAVNALHFKAGQNTKENRGVIWSLSPAATTSAGRVSLQSEVSPGSSCFTDIPGGRGIFGGPFTPFVGNPIMLDNDRNNVLKPLPDSYVPKLGDTWTVLIERPRRYPREIVFENRYGGLITIQYRGSAPKVIGSVLRPVIGVGRFIGSYFSERGRLRANHNGVIDIATVPPETTGTRGRVGSFQIVPANHAMSPETHYIRELTQWMVVGPVSALDPSWEGTAPLFSQFLRPRNDPADVQGDWVEDLAGRFYFDCKLRGKNGVISDWQPFPYLFMSPDALPTWAATALQNVTHIRIVFPFHWDDNSELNSTTTPPAVAPPGTTQSTLDAQQQDEKKQGQTP